RHLPVRAPGRRAPEHAERRADRQDRARGERQRAMSLREAAPAAATKFGALYHRDYRNYFLLALLGMTAESIEHVTSYWVIFESFHSPTLGGFAVISHWVPFLVLSVYMGALADRYDCRKLIQAGQALFMFASLAWGLLFLTNRLQMWHAVVILLVHGTAGVLMTPA